MKTLTRVLVLTGLVTMTNAHGQVEGRADSLLIAREGEAPVKQVVKANSDFAVDMYKQFSKENPGGNLFFSPYSISSAMSMLGEGAHGKSAAELAKLLHLPQESGRKGDLSQQIPLRASMLHSGFQHINNTLNRNKSPELLKVTNQLAVLRREYNNLRKSITKEEREKFTDGGAPNAKIARENDLARQINLSLIHI